MKFLSLVTAGVIAATLALSSCGGGGGDGGGIGGTGSSAPGTMRLSLTDAPACGHDAVYVTIDRIRVHQDSAAADTASGWQDIVVSPARRIDLLTLTNGVLTELGEASLPAGRYTQMRLVLAPNDTAQPRANAVVPTGGTETEMATPSGQQSGIKLDIGIDVPVGQVADVVLDFDACKSVVKRGNSGQFNLKPVIAAIPVQSDAGMRVTGHVDAAVATGHTTVSLQFDGTPVKATVPDPTGRFVLYPVPTGTYDLVVSAQGRVTAVVKGVPVTADAQTVINSQAARILPPATSSRAVTGTVSPASATVRALQTLSGGPTVETAWLPVDPASGAFDGALPDGAPVVAPFSASPLVFAADTSAAGNYTVEAMSGPARQTRSITAVDLTSSLTFNFP